MCWQSERTHHRKSSSRALIDVGRESAPAFPPGKLDRQEEAYESNSFDRACSINSLCISSTVVQYVHLQDTFVFFFVRSLYLQLYA